MVLVEGAVQVTPEATNRQNQAAGVKPLQGRLLNGDHGQVGRLPIVQGNAGSVLTDPGPVKAGLPLG